MASPFAVDAGLHFLGLTDQQRAEVEQRTIPAIDNLVVWYQKNPETIKNLVGNVNAAAPGIQILMDAMAGKSMTLSDIFKAEPVASSRGHPGTSAS